MCKLKSVHFILFFHLILTTAWFKSLLIPSTSFCSDLKTKIWLQHTMPMNRPHYSIKTVTLVYGCLFWVTAWIYLDASTKVLDVMTTFGFSCWIDLQDDSMISLPCLFPLNLLGLFFLFYLKCTCKRVLSVGSWIFIMTLFSLITFLQ